MTLERSSTSFCVAVRAGSGGRPSGAAATLALLLILAGGAVRAHAATVEEAIPPIAENADSPLEAALVEDLSDGRLDAHALADAVLVASGLEDASTLSQYRARLDQVVAETIRRVGTYGRPERRARRLLVELHRSVLRKYEISSDRMVDLLDRGVYNCVSATLLYMIAARELGLSVQAAETPLHVFVVLSTPRRRIDIETTTPKGFDARRGMESFRAFVLANKYTTEEDLALRGLEAVYNDFHRRNHPVTPERVMAFLYHNAGLRALQAGDPAGAARSLVKSGRIYPNLAYRSEDLRAALAWAVREQYDAGSYAEALRLSGLTMQFFPDRTTVKDRFIAVGARMVEDAANAGNLAVAQQTEARVLARLADEESRRRLEAHTSPLLARAALLVRDWPVARRCAARFRQVSPDPVEGERFARWVESRADEGSGMAGAGAAPLEFLVEARAAIEAAPSTEDPREHEAVVGAIAALASQGRFDEALAVGRVVRDRIAGRDAGTPAAGLDLLLKAVAARQITNLLSLRRWREASEAAEAALAQWPGDGDVAALRRWTLTALSQDPYRLDAWPRGAEASGEPALPSSRLTGTLAR